MDADYKSLTNGMSYNFAEPFYGMRFGFDASVTDSDYASSIFAPFEHGPRNDKTLTLGTSINFANVEYYDFQPVIKFETLRTESNISFHNRDFASIGFDLRSSF